MSILSLSKMPNIYKFVLSIYFQILCIHGYRYDPLLQVSLYMPMWICLKGENIAVLYVIVTEAQCDGKKISLFLNHAFH